MTHIEQRPYGYLVSTNNGRWRYSFVRKEGTNAYELGSYVGPSGSEAGWCEKNAAKAAMLRNGHELVV